MRRHPNGLIAIMKPTEDQVALFHVWCREIAKHCKDNGANVSEEIVKQLVKRNLGNCVGASVGSLGVIASMPTMSYKSHQADLTEKDIEQGFISFEELLTKVQAWAATDLGLELKSKNEEM